MGLRNSNSGPLLQTKFDHATWKKHIRERKTIVKVQYEASV